MAPQQPRPTIHRPTARTAKRRTARAERPDSVLASRTCDEIMSIMSHDLRAPLLTISTCAHALQRDPSNVGELAGMIEQAAAWSRRLINDLLDASAIQTGRLQVHRQPTSLHAMLELASSSFTPVAAARDVALAVTPPPTDVQLLVDPDRVLQALGNLITNAIRASSPGTVRVDAVVRPRSVVVRVADDGAGIEPRRLAALVGRRTLHRDTARDGNGLGLAIARGIATAHGGRLSAASTIGQGSTFSLSLPRMTSRASG